MYNLFGITWLNKHNKKVINQINIRDALENKILKINQVMQLIYTVKYRTLQIKLCHNFDPGIIDYNVIIFAKKNQ